MGIHSYVKTGSRREGPGNNLYWGILPPRRTIHSDTMPIQHGSGKGIHIQSWKQQMAHF